nr:class I SAM-dependent methyltransferase [Chloroflexota bacterium]
MSEGRSQAVDAEPATTLARYYDLDLLDDPDDLTLYEALAQRCGGAILELGAGSGRLAVALAAQGHSVTAVDNDPAMMQRARGAWQRSGSERSGSLQLVEGDMLDLDLPHRFDLVILALNTLLLLGERARQQAAMRTMARHLSREGRAVVDVWLPGASDLALYDGRLLLEWLRDDPETGERVAKTASALHDAATATVTLTQLFDAWRPEGGALRRVSRVDALHLLGADELAAMAATAGLAVERLAGDHQMGDFGPGA